VVENQLTVIALMARGGGEEGCFEESPRKGQKEIKTPSKGQAKIENEHINSQGKRVSKAQL